MFIRLATTTTVSTSIFLRQSHRKEWETRGVFYVTVKCPGRARQRAIVERVLYHRDKIGIYVACVGRAQGPSPSLTALAPRAPWTHCAGRNAASVASHSHHPLQHRTDPPAPVPTPTDSGTRQAVSCLSSAISS